MKLGEPSVSELQVIAWMVFITRTCRRNYVVCRVFFFFFSFSHFPYLLKGYAEGHNSVWFSLMF